LLLQLNRQGSRKASNTSDMAFQWLRHPDGNCLEATQPDINGGWLSVLPCDDENTNQLWSYHEAGLVKHHQGKCLDASQRNTNGGLIHIWDCDASNQNQLWDYTEETMQMKNRHGKCLDGPEPHVVGSRVHMWSCMPENTNQHWSFEDSNFLPSSTKESLTTTDTDSTSSTTTLTTSTTKKAETMLTAFRNCYLEPPVEGAGCKLVKVKEAPSFDLNNYGHETAGRYNCLHWLRNYQVHHGEESADTFVHSVGRCELWLCKSLARLRNSAGPGGGAASMANGISLRSHLGTYVAAEMDGSMHANGEEFAPESQFQMVPGRGDDGKIALIAQNGLYVKAAPSGYMSATAEALDDWEEFEVVNSSAGLIALKSWHNQYVVAEQSGTLLANRPLLDAWEEFRLVNRSAEKAGDEVEPVPRERAAVFSNMCDYQPGLGGLHGKQVRSPVFVKLWEWNYPDIAKECEEYLAPNGFDAVQISPVIEHIKGYQWWTKYQPVSQGLHTRSGTAKEFTDMVARCRAVGVEVIVDMLLNHMASPCAAAKKSSDPAPCEGWGGSKYGKRVFNGSRGWDKAEPRMFHHQPEDEMKGICSVGPHTGWLCPQNDCTPCDMYGMPDWNTGLAEVRDMHAKHLLELFRMGVTMLRLDAAIYHDVEDLASMLNRVPWDLVYQEWWGEFPPEERTEYVGHYRDVNYRWQVVNRMANKDVSDFPELLTLRGGVHGINEDMAVYPFAYHDGRSKRADPETATYKNGLEFHQQQKFFLGWPHGIAVLVWGGYGWQDTEQGPPGCDKDSGEMCKAEAVFDADGTPRCLATPTRSPLPEAEAGKRGWVCEHRWQGVAGMINFRKACRGLPLVETWQGNESLGVTPGRLAYKLASEDGSEACFVALVRGYNEVSEPDWGHLGDWQLNGLYIGLPAGTYCDLASLETQRGWDRQSCPKEVVIGENGTVEEGIVSEGDLLAIRTGAQVRKAQSRQNTLLSS